MLKYTNFKYCPKCGSLDLIVLDSNGMQCTTCGYIYYHNTASAVAAIIETPSGVLLVKRNHEPKKGLIDFPGGFVNYKESLESAIRREIKEELSIDLQSIEYFGSFPNIYIYEKTTYFTTDVFFRCLFQTTPEIKPNNEISDFSFYLKEEIEFVSLAFESGKEALKYYLSN